MFKERTGKTGVGSLIFLILVLLFMYLPIAVVILYSFNANTSRIPILFTGFSGIWYEKLFSGKSGYGDALLLSLKVAAVSVGVSTVIGTAGAVAMAQRVVVHREKPTRLDRIMETIVSLPMMIPEIIMGLCMMVILNLMGVKGNDLRLILAHITFCIPYIFMNVKSRLMTMDPALFDAARDLGAPPRRIVWDIMLPLCRSAILSGAMLALAMSLDDFVISFFVYGSGEGTLPIRIYSSMKVGVSPQINALCSLMIGAVFAIAAIYGCIKNTRLRKTNQLGGKL